jgi:hypothetical protein
MIKIYLAAIALFAGIILTGADGPYWPYHNAFGVILVALGAFFLYKFSPYVDDTTRPAPRRDPISGR